MEEMSDVHDFMAKFGSDFEIKWGLATDPELGCKVKVTILATGFGIANVEGMDAHIRKQHTQEENDRRVENEQKKEDLRAKIDHYYGPDGKNSTYKRRPNIFIFRPEDLDNDNVISQVGSTPTYKRTRQDLIEIRNQSVGLAKKNVPEDNKVQGTIRFA